MRESSIQRDIRLHLGQKDDCQLRRNNVGAWQDGHGNWIEYGLGEGSSDLVGLVTLDMATPRLARVFCLEIKKPGGRTSKTRKEQQRLFRDCINKAGGYAAEVSSVEEAEEAYQRARAGLSARI
jgi:hypothetical protein